MFTSGRALCPCFEIKDEGIVVILLKSRDEHENYLSVSKDKYVGLLTQLKSTISLNSQELKSEVDFDLITGTSENFLL